MKKNIKLIKNKFLSVRLMIQTKNIIKLKGI